MSKYSYELDNGKQLELEGDSPPSDDEVESIAKEQGVKLQIADTKFTPKVDVSPSTEVQPKTEEKPSLLKRGWDAISKPLTDAPSRFAKSINSYLDTPESHLGNENPVVAFGKGALQGLGDTISGLTSPLNLGLTALTGGASLAESAGLPAIVEGMNLGSRILSAPIVTHGAGQVFSPDSTMGERGFGLAEIAGGLAGMKGHTPSEEIPSGIPSEYPSEMVHSIPESISQEQIRPNTITIKKPTKELVAQLRKEGYDSAGISDEGYPIMKRQLDETVTSHDEIPPEQIMNDEHGVQSTSYERPPGPWDNNTAVETSKLPNTEDLIYKNATEKFGMGLPHESDVIPPQQTELPQQTEIPSIEVKPKAEFLGLQQDGQPLFNIVGGESDKSTASLDGLKQLGIEVPEIPPDAVPMKGSQLREIALQKMKQSVPSELPESWKGLTEPLTPEQTSFNKPISPNDMGVANEMNEGPRQMATQSNQPTNPIQSNIDPRTQALLNKNKPPINQEQIPNEMNKVNKQAQIIKMAPVKEKDGLIRQALNTQRTLLTSYDFSAPGRQGLPLIGRKEWWTSLDDMFKAWGSEKAFNTIQNSITEHPSGYFKSGINQAGKRIPSYAEKVGLELTDLLSKNEEVFKGTLADKIPGVRPSNRAFVGYLNKLRSDTFANMVDLAKDQGKNPETDLILGKQIADFVNNATGRGSLGKLEPNAKLLADVFFAPRLMASRIKTYTQVLNPKFYTELDPSVRKEALKSLFALAGTGTLMGELAKLHPDVSVDHDPTSTDFMKIRIGKTRIDPFGGFQQYPVAAAKLLMGQSTSSTSGKVTDLTAGKFGQQNRASVVSNFFKNKLAPVPSFVWSWLEGKEFDGTPFDAKKALLNRTVPMVMQDIADLAKEDPKLLPLSVLPIGGMNIQTYGR